MSNLALDAKLEVCLFYATFMFFIGIKNHSIIKGLAKVRRIYIYIYLIIIPRIGYTTIAQSS